eukprot:Hpha_TRINITY_DN34867_c0_g1::TRINITY_DN34867_c0_g1_i1::g.167855::m.167855
MKKIRNLMKKNDAPPPKSLLERVLSTTPATAPAGTESLWQRSDAIVQGLPQGATMWSARPAAPPPPPRAADFVGTQGQGGSVVPPPYASLAEAAKRAMRPTSSTHDSVSCAAEGVQRLRRIPSHPGIIKVIDGKLDAREVVVMTERATTLRTRLLERGVSLGEVCTGVNQIAEVLEWLHRTCRLAYNNVSLDGIWVANRPGEGVRWVLGDFSFCSPLDAWDACRTTMAHQSVVAPEDFLKTHDPGLTLGGRDVYALGAVVDQLIAAMGAGHVPSGLSRSEDAKIRRAAELRSEMFRQATKQVLTCDLELCQVQVRSDGTLTHTVTSLNNTTTAQRTATATTVRRSSEAVTAAGIQTVSSAVSEPIAPPLPDTSP